jgi:predicted nuclease of predicted toxin-antitoxin system
MAKQKFTVFQKLDNAITGKWNNNTTHSNSYDFSSNDGIVYKTDNEEDYLKTKKELQQNAYLNQRWLKANADLSVQAFAGLNNVKLMYRDADLMDAFPEIGMALDIMSEESCTVNSQNRVVSVYSSSDRIKSVLEELFVNRLDINVTAPMIIRGMCKYGNQFMLLNINNQNGITGWRQLPPYNVERLENGVVNPYGMGNLSSDVSEDDMKTKFVWLGENNSQTPFRNWQIGHFRLLTDSLYLPYGVSILQKARRHWRMLSLMEDMMLIYRLERSIERRVYKIYVGAIDDADVQAYVQEIANNFKRTLIIDPMTGQVDLRKNLLPVRRDTPIPLLDGRTITIEELAKEYEEGKENYVY